MVASEGGQEPQATAPPVTPALAGKRQSFVSFRLDRELFALPLERVERALRMVALVHLPETPAWIAGVINMQGQVLPVLDLGQLFGRLPRAPHPDQRLLVVSQEPRKVALQVDGVGKVLTAGPAEVEPPSGHLAGSRVLAGVLRDGEDLVLILDPESLAPADWRNQEDLWQQLEDQAARLLAESNE